MRVCAHARDPGRGCVLRRVVQPMPPRLLRRFHDNEPPSINHREDRFRVGRGGERPPRAEFSALLMATDLGLPPPPLLDRLIHRHVGGDIAVLRTKYRRIEESFSPSPSLRVFR